MTPTQELLLVSQKPSTSHLLHLIITIVTAGVWIPIWIIIVLINQQRCTNIDRRIKREHKAAAKAES